MESLAKIYKARNKEAIALALNGDEEEALNILFEMRSKPDIGVYRRAHVSSPEPHLIPASNVTKVNMGLAILAIGSDERLKYAEECLDLIDIIRKEENYNSDNLDNLEDHAKDVIKHLHAEIEVAKQDAVVKAQESEVTAQASEQVVSQREDEDGGDGVLPPVGRQGRKSRLLFTWKSSTQVGETVAQPKIEGYLRETWYPPRDTSRDTNKQQEQ